jgi:hypothetical protein
LGAGLSSEASCSTLEVIAGSAAPDEPSTHASIDILEGRGCRPRKRRVPRSLMGSRLHAGGSDLDAISLIRRLEALEANATGAVLQKASVWMPLGMSPSEEADLGACKAPSPRQTLAVVSWGERGA